MAGCDDDDKVSRGELLRQFDIALTGPEPPDCPALFVILGVGLHQPGMMGLDPIAPGTINDWAAGMGLEVTSWEFETALMVSRAFVAGTKLKQSPVDPVGVSAALSSARMMAQMME